MGVEETPPLPVTILNGLQHAGVLTINLVYPLLVFRALDLPIEAVTSLISAGMLVLGLATLLQSWRLGPIGSGFMCPSATFTATYLAPSLLAAKTGGIALVFGMTIFAGVLEAALAPFLNRLRAIFPPEVSGLVIFIISRTVPGGIAGLRLRIGANVAPMLPAEWFVERTDHQHHGGPQHLGQRRGLHVLRPDRTGGRLRRVFSGGPRRQQRARFRRGNAVDRAACDRVRADLRSRFGGTVRDRQPRDGDEGRRHDHHLPEDERRGLGAARHEVDHGGRVG